MSSWAITVRTYGLRRRAPHDELVGLGVVEADDAGAEQRAERLDEVGAGLEQAEGLEHPALR